MSNDLKHIVMIVLGLAGLVVLGLFFITITKSSGLKNKGPQTQVSQTQTQESSAGKSGSFVLTTPETSGVSAGQPLLIEISMNTNGKDLTGYDAVLSLDVDNIEVQDVKTDIKGFQVFKKIEAGIVKLTGIKGPTVKEETVLAGESAVRIVLVPKRSGTYEIALIKSKDKSMTKFIDNKTTVYYPEINSISVVVK